MGFRTLTPRNHLLPEKWFGCSSESVEDILVVGARVLHRKPIRYCFKTEAGIAGESVQNTTGVTEKTVVIRIGIKEGDLEASKAEKFGEFKGKREDEDMGRVHPSRFWFTISRVISLY